MTKFGVIYSKNAGTTFYRSLGVIQKYEHSIGGGVSKRGGGSRQRT